MNDSIIALDIGERRIGVARAGSVARIAEPLTTLSNDDTFSHQLEALLKEHRPAVVVVGLPRNLSGDETAQTTYVREFVNKLDPTVRNRVVFQDEAVTSVKAEEFLHRNQKSYTKDDIDAVAAMFILEDYLQTGERQ